MILDHSHFLLICFFIFVWRILFNLSRRLMSNWIEPLHTDFVCNSATLDESLLLLRQLTAKLIDFLMLVENLQFLEVEVSLLEFHALFGILLNQTLSFSLHLEICDLGLSSLFKICFYSLFFLFHLIFEPSSILRKFILALLCHSQLFLRFLFSSYTGLTFCLFILFQSFFTLGKLL